MATFLGTYALVRLFIQRFCNVASMSAIRNSNIFLVLKTGNQNLSVTVNVPLTVNYSCLLGFSSLLCDLQSVAPNTCQG